MKGKVGIYFILIFNIPIILQDAKHRRSAALRDGGYQGEKRDFPPDCKRE